MIERALKTVDHFKQRTHDLALAAAAGGRALALDPPTIVVEIGQRAQIHVVLVTLTLP